MSSLEEMDGIACVGIKGLRSLWKLYEVLNTSECYGMGFDGEEDCGREMRDLLLQCLRTGSIHMQIWSPSCHLCLP